MQTLLRLDTAYDARIFWICLYDIVYVCVCGGGGDVRDSVHNIILVSAHGEY